MTNYPAQIDTNQSFPPAVDALTPVSASVFNTARTTIITIESELGVKPSGTYGTVRARLDNLENIIGNLQIITLAGDLGGNISNPLVVGLQGRPLSTAQPSFGQVLYWNGIAWVPQNTTAVVTFNGDLSGTGASQKVVGLQGIPISSATPIVDNVLVFDGYHWGPGTGGGSGGVAGGDLLGSYPNPSVIKINGATVPSSGSLVTGNILQVTGASSLSYAPINLAGGTNFVSGVLPVGNQANQTMSGDVTGTTSASTVAKLQSFAVDTITPQDKNILTWNNSVSKWQPQFNNNPIVGNATWSQSTWFIDPGNSTGLAADTNSGVDDTHPVLTWNGGVMAKLGAYSPSIKQNTTFTFLSSHPDMTDPVVFSPLISNGAIVVIMGKLPTPVHSGTLASVSDKNFGVNGSGTLLQSDMGFSASGQLLINSSLSGARCFVYRNVSGTIYNLSQPFHPYSPFISFLGEFPTEENGFANGQSFALYNMLQINIAQFTPIIVDFTPAQTSVGSLYQMVIPDNSFNSLILSDNAFIIDCQIHKFTLLNNVNFATLVNNDFQQQLSVRSAISTFNNLSVEIFGGILASYSLLTGAMLDNNIIIGANEILINNCSLGEIFIDNNTGNNTILCYGETDGYLSTTPLIYGPSTLNVVDGRFKISNSATAATDIFKQGTLFLGNNPTTGIPDNTANAYDASADPAVWHPGRSMATGSGVGANIDVSISSGGFGGLAISLSGASIVKVNANF